MKKNWIKIFSSNDNFKIEVLKNLLLSNNIPAVVINNKDSSYLMFGTIDLYIENKNKENAIQILSNEKIQ